MFAILDKFDANGVSFKKHAFDDGVLTLMVVYRNQFMQIQEFLSDVAKFSNNIFYRH